MGDQTEVRHARIEPEMMLAAVCFLELALVDLDFLSTTKADLVKEHGPAKARLFYLDAVAGAGKLRDLLGVMIDGWEPLPWEAIP